MRLRGTLRALYQPSVLLRYLFVCKTLCKEFKNYARGLTQRILAQAEQMAQGAGRPWIYVGSTKTSKEELVRQIARDQPVERGLIAVLRCVEPCQTYEMRGIKPQLRQSKCLHLYFYHLDPVFGFLHLRLQTWFPFQVEICLNGREWLARQMDRAALSYQRQDNYFPWIENLARAQQLMDRQLQTRWPAALERLLRQNHPLHREICRPLNLE